MPVDLTSVCKEIYNNLSEWIRSTEASSKVAPSVLLVLEGILPHVERINGGYEFGNETKVKILAYADDICVTGRTKEELERMLERIYKYIQWVGLKFNPAKCGSLSIINYGVRK